MFLSNLFSMALISINLVALTSNRKISSTEIPECSNSCPTDQVCMNTFTSDGAKCFPVPSLAPITNLHLPFDEKTEVFCTHSSGSGSHSGTNAFFALDLASNYSKKAAVVKAAADGVAFVFGSESGELCPEPRGSPENAESSTCGESWGNRIKIIHQDGYFSFYVHLDKPLVKTGDFVHRGDSIGIEGWTGAAGHRHLHWSIQKLPGKNNKEWLSQIPTFTGESVPFNFKAVQEGMLRDFNVMNIKCAHANIGKAPTGQQPKFKGMKK